MEREPLECPFCTAGASYQERRGPQIFCNVCARCWYPETKHDRAVLKTLRQFGEVTRPTGDDST